eukprot:GHVT01048477.1.p1 GENE.GHVT01048477.1~~GHVT01048477.1.p1  ORF type:complete len:451 (-),score=58.04 GHVT01048477.1:726-2078(-)
MCTAPPLSELRMPSWMIQNKAPTDGVLEPTTTINAQGYSVADLQSAKVVFSLAAFITLHPCRKTNALTASDAAAEVEGEGAGLADTASAVASPTSVTPSPAPVKGSVPGGDFMMRPRLATELIRPSVFQLIGETLALDARSLFSMRRHACGIFGTRVSDFEVIYDCLPPAEVAPKQRPMAGLPAPCAGRDLGVAVPQSLEKGEGVGPHCDAPNSALAALGRSLRVPREAVQRFDASAATNKFEAAVRSPEAGEGKIHLGPCVHASTCWGPSDLAQTGESPEAPAHCALASKPTRADEAAKAAARRQTAKRPWVRVLKVQCTGSPRRQHGPNARGFWPSDQSKRDGAGGKLGGDGQVARDTDETAGGVLTAEANSGGEEIRWHGSSGNEGKRRDSHADTQAIAYRETDHGNCTGKERNRMRTKQWLKDVRKFLPQSLFTMSLLTETQKTGT